MPIQTKKSDISPCEAKSKNVKIEICSIRVEYDRNLSHMRSTAKAFDFFDRSSQMERTNVTWYFGKIKSDLADEGQKSMFSLPHWYIKTNNPQLFNFMDKTFTCIDLIFGQEKTYWKLSCLETFDTKEEQIIEGEIELNVGTCSCCIDTQYPKIIEALQKQCQSSSSSSS